EMHYDLFVILFILLAAFFYQRKAFLLGWVCLLLATLMNALVLLLLLLFMRALWKESRAMLGGHRFLWWVSILGLSAVIVVLAYFLTGGAGASPVLKSRYARLLCRIWSSIRWMPP